VEHLQAFVRDVPDFPKPGIMFKDITPLLQNADAFAQTLDLLVDRYQNEGIDKIAAIDARGFIFGSALAALLGTGLVLVRKPGKLPYQKVRKEYELEYGTDALEIHKDAIDAGEKVLVVDDLLATGGTARATCDLIHSIGANVYEICFMIELVVLKGRDRIGTTPVFSLMKY
jgi:adenine phosphoribosyltransferase